ncbi:zinc finger protein ZAT5-like [Cynara cardunculus var. scolymus]|uniref:Zinc finger, C2H2 n=1 Tax=Cynara cardunculus var. scolymus TaxID=59895 RepID=A0A103XS01_CYNCS|nr:zinc finger protein ZAT5-like [Cynara cardunculus var. scolymus]KVH95805.1 Zinc finger, C2H2 [Cynara cardunculus var. scolymus]
MPINMNTTPTTQPPPPPPTTTNNTNCTIINHSPEISASANSTSPAENSGYRRYECKTCRKQFDTFQALGGHQGIHRKLIHNEDACSLSLQIAAVPKLHQCKACMKKFPTGQALGGHMRRHRLKKTLISMNKEQLQRQQAAEEVVGSDSTSAAVEPQWLKAEEDQQHKLKSELVLAAKELRLSI